jgi:SAM-dependent methyltransferase
LAGDDPIHSRDLPAPPASPPADLERAFVGSSGRAALEEVVPFYAAVMRHCRLGRFSKLLDFGCGFGRITRLFLRDAREIFGVDVDGECIAFCRDALPDCEFVEIAPEPPLPFQDGTFDGVVAYSVFSHLSEALFHAYLEEFRRLLRAGGTFCFTTLKTAHIERWRVLGSSDPEFSRVLDGVGFNPATWALRASMGDFLFVPIGGGADTRPPSLYGEAVVPRRYLNKAAGQHGYALVEFDDDVLPQSLVVLRRR